MTNKEAREELKYIKESFAQNALSYEALDLADTALKIMELLMDGYRPYTIMQEWMPVGERLPEESDPVLLYYERDSWQDNKRLRVKDIDKGWQWDGFWHVDGVSGVKAIAWMPLPQPYKEGEKDEINNS